MFYLQQYKFAYATRPARLGWVQGTPAQFLKNWGSKRVFINIEVYNVNTFDNQIM